MLEFRGIAKTYGERPLLAGLDLAVPAGDFLVIYGPPASGKSVLLRLLMGLETPTSGQVWLRGVDATPIAAAERNIGYVPQSFALYPHLSVRDNIAYPLQLAGTPKADREAIVRRAATMLKIGELLGKRPDQLSGGQKQRVAIARGIAKETEIFVLDDPLAGLDFKLREQLVDDLKVLQEETRATFVYTTSDPIEALTLADNLAVLVDGRIVEAGEPERLYRSPAHLRTMELVGFPRTNFVPGTLRGADGALRCETPLFVAAMRPESDARQEPGEWSVSVGVRPEDVVLVEERTRSSLAAEWLPFSATVTLREDLGGEEIVYLDAGGTPLTTVIRHHAGQANPDLGQRVDLAVRVSDLLVFDAGSGRRIARGIETSNG